MLWKVLISMCSGFFVLCYTQNDNGLLQESKITAKIGNMTAEILYRTLVNSKTTGNFIISPLAIWTNLVLLYEAARGDTFQEIKLAGRFAWDRVKTINDFKNLGPTWNVNSSSLEVKKISTIFNSSPYMENDFKETIASDFDTATVPINFTDPKTAAFLVKKFILQFTGRKKPTLSMAMDFTANNRTAMLLLSVLYLHGHWTYPFDPKETQVNLFFDSFGNRNSHCSMIYRRHKYAYLDSKVLKAEVIDIPIGRDKQVSMLIFLPNVNISVDVMIRGFEKISPKDLLSQLKESENKGGVTIDCTIPKFHVKSNFDMKKVFMDLGIYSLFSETDSVLSYLSRIPMYVSRAVHTAEIGIDEGGLKPSPLISVSPVVPSNDVKNFEANRPFVFWFIEKKSKYYSTCRCVQHTDFIK